MGPIESVTDRTHPQVLSPQRGPGDPVGSGQEIGLIGMNVLWPNVSPELIRRNMTVKKIVVIQVMLLLYKVSRGIFNIATFPTLHVPITEGEALVGGRVGNPRGLIVAAGDCMPARVAPVSLWTDTGAVRCVTNALWACQNQRTNNCAPYEPAAEDFLEETNAEC